MKLYFILVVILTVVMMILPASAKLFPQKNKAEIIVTTSSINESDNNHMNVLRTDFDKIDLTEYIIGTVAGEMPGGFSEEALKAQAVVSYTYVKYIMNNPTYGKKYITDLCYTHQTYIDIAQQKEKWGENYKKYRNRIENAVKSVIGQYLSYDGKPALAVFHAISSGKTKSSLEAWGQAVPYLIETDAPGDKISENYESIISLTPEKFQSAFSKYSDVNFNNSDFSRWVSVTEKDSYGYIKKLKVNNREFTSYEFMSILNLPSPTFEGTIKNGNFIFTVYGKGHGVGMSQYSADYLARQGADYKKILEHFYPGTVILQD